jgi:hypothetical protein
MSGRALALQLLKIRPRLKVLYMSGYADKAIVQHGVLEAGTNFLGKPFTTAVLTQKVGEVLDDGTDKVAQGREPAPGPDVEKKELPLNRDTLRLLSPDLLDRLRKAVIAARYDEIVGLIDMVRITQPDVAEGLNRMANLFDYDGMRDILSQ